MTTNTDIVSDPIVGAILDLEGRIGTDDERDYDQSVLSLLNEAHRLMGNP